MKKTLFIIVASFSFIVEAQNSSLQELVNQGETISSLISDGYETVEFYIKYQNGLILIFKTLVIHNLLGSVVTPTYSEQACCQ